ncbi:hypothetical protein BJ912DRAFT_950906 [Pholiota molesta]|nr:hypothetical protein BJ912DRAFT_950906 [Pholiota molesta]
MSAAAAMFLRIMLRAAEGFGRRERRRNGRVMGGEAVRRFRPPAANLPRRRTPCRRRPMGLRRAEVVDSNWTWGQFIRAGARYKATGARSSSWVVPLVHGWRLVQADMPRCAIASSLRHLPPAAPNTVRSEPVVVGHGASERDRRHGCTSRARLQVGRGAPWRCLCTMADTEHPCRL